VGAEQICGQLEELRMSWSSKDVGTTVEETEELKLVSVHQKNGIAHLLDTLFQGGRNLLQELTYVPKAQLHSRASSFFLD
jgi:hypothetical protein